MKKNLPLILAIAALVALGIGISLAQGWYRAPEKAPEEAKSFDDSGIKPKEPMVSQEAHTKGELELSILRCVPDGVSVCLPIGSQGICEEQASRATEYTAHNLGLVGTITSGAFQKPLKISYLVTATDEQGNTVIVVPETVQNELKAPFTEPLNLSFVASLQPGEYKIIVNATSPDTGTSYQKSAPLIIARSQDIERNPGYCNAVMDAR